MAMCTPQASRRRLLAVVPILFAAAVAWLALPGGATAETSEQAAVNTARAIGSAQAASSAQAVRDGSAENATVRRTVPNYTANPAQAQSYAGQDAAVKADQQRLRCQQTPSDPVCSATSISSTTQQRDPTLSPSDPLLAGQAAVDRPQSVLGDIATTYNACSVGGVMTAPAVWQRNTCALDTAAWTDQTCTKSLDVSPVATTSCQAGAVIASQSIAGEGPVQVQAYCNPATGSRVRITASAVGGHGACAPPMDTVVDLSQAQPLGITPPTRIGTLQPHWFGGCFPLGVYWEGAGCQSGTCTVNIHFVADPGTEPDLTCPSGQSPASQITFWNPDLMAPDYGRYCYVPFPDYDSAGGLPGGYGESAGVPAYWGATSVASPSGWHWAAGLHYTATLTFPEPRVIPPRGDVWTSTCQPYEQLAGSLGPDGQPPQSALAMPAIGSEQQCVRTSSVCTDGPSTRTISGLQVTRQCWNYTNTFACTSLAATSTCSAASLSACSPTGAPSCVQQDGLNHCTQAALAFDCKVQEATFTQAVNCGGSSYCQGGSCLATSSQPNANFSSSVAQLQAHREAAKDIDPDTLQIFKGTDRRCHKDSFGIDNCCDNTAYLQQCSNDEQETVRRRDQGQCHEVGQYCSAGSILGCRERTKTYCCFSSMLGRIVQEQGRQQLARDWGTPQSPNCVGFTTTEIAALDWSRFDLSEFYAHIHVASGPDQGAVTTGAQNKQQSCYYGDGRC